MSDTKMYTKDEVRQTILLFLALLDSGIFDAGQGENDMVKRLKQYVTIHGKGHWVTGQTMADLLENYRKLIENSVSENQNGSKNSVKFGDYLRDYVRTYKSTQSSSTMVNRERILKNHIIPRFGDIPIDDITTGDIQEWFNELAKTYSKETILKIKNIMSPVFDGAVEDGYIKRNPLHSSRLKIEGRPTVHHRALPPDKIATVRNTIPVMDVRERRMTALLCSTGMRIEEILGLRWEDIDTERDCIHIRRAVVHPGRSAPEVKTTKNGKERVIPIPQGLLAQLSPRERTGFVLNSYCDLKRERPLSYTEYRRSFDRIRKLCGIEDYSAHDFRDTCATEWRESGISIDMIARLLGHQKTDVTEQRYVKYRPELYKQAQEKMSVYGTSDGTKRER